MNSLSLAPTLLPQGLPAVDGAEPAAAAAQPTAFAAALQALEQVMTAAATGETGGKAVNPAPDGKPATLAGKFLPGAAKLAARVAGKGADPEAGIEAQDGSAEHKAASDAGDTETITAPSVTGAVALVPLAIIPLKAKATAASALAPAPSPAAKPQPDSPSPTLPQTAVSETLPPARSALRPEPNGSVLPAAGPVAPVAAVKLEKRADQPFALMVRGDDQSQPAVFAPRTAAIASLIQRNLRFEPVDASVQATTMSVPVATATFSAATAHGLGTVQTAPQGAQAEPQDFSTLVDRLVAARDAAQGDVVRVALPHAEFGRVALHFRNDDAGLSVTMTSADPGFARAVTAALPAQNSAGTDSSTSGNSQHQHRGESTQTGAAAADRGSAGAGQGQARGQHQRTAEPFDNHGVRPRARNASAGDERGGIFA